MKHLWSPWRMTYIEGSSDEPGCLFCNRMAQPDGVDNLIVYRGQNVFVILNRYPYTNGHMMLVPYNHQSTLEALDRETLAELMLLTSKAVSVLRLVYGAENFNIGINIGEAAGAGIEEHVHVHVLPRWPGDTNFMATTAQTRVVPEALEKTFERIRAGWQQIETEHK